MSESKVPFRDYDHGSPELNQAWQNTKWCQRSLFNHFYSPDPSQFSPQEVCDLNIAGAVLNMVFGLRPAPRLKNPKEYDLLVKSATLMAESDPSVAFGVGMTMHHVRLQNPQFKAHYEQRLAEAKQD